jgi:arylformamidase
MSWIDVSLPVKTAMVHWPGNPVPTLRQLLSIANGDVCNLTAFEMGAHTGTHMDAPRHFIDGGETMENMPLDAVIGPAEVIEIRDAEIRRAHLEPLGLTRGSRVLFKTSNSERLWLTDEFQEEFVAVMPDAAAYLVERGVQTVGVDCLSVAPFSDSVTTHRILLGAGIWVIEGLNLRDIEPGSYDLVCLPLKMVGSDGAPSRCVLRRRQAPL